MSSRADTCPHCGYSRSGMSAEDDERKIRFKHYLKVQSLNTQGALAVMLFVIGFAYMKWGGKDPSALEWYIAMTISGVGFCWYIVNRVRMVMARKSR